MFGLALSERGTSVWRGRELASEFRKRAVKRPKSVSEVGWIAWANRTAASEVPSIASRAQPASEFRLTSWQLQVPVSAIRMALLQFQYCRLKAAFREQTHEIAIRLMVSKPQMAACGSQSFRWIL